MLPPALCGIKKGFSKANHPVWITCRQTGMDTTIENEQPLAKIVSRRKPFLSMLIGRIHSVSPFVGSHSRISGFFSAQKAGISSLFFIDILPSLHYNNTHNPYQKGGIV